LWESVVYIGDLAFESQPQRLFEAPKTHDSSSFYPHPPDYAQAAKKPQLFRRFFGPFFSLWASPF
jgi:hypothetical protein